MAIKANAVKGGIKIPEAYLVIASVRMEKYLRPVLDEETRQFSHNEAAVQYSAGVSIYSNEAERRANYGSSEFNYHVIFEHTDGADPVREAYEAVAKDGIPGWLLTDVVSV